MKKILIVKLSSLGDIIHALPMVAGLKKENPKNFIAWLVGRQHSAILENNPCIDQLIFFERERWRGLRTLTRQNEIWQLVATIRKMNFDVAFDCQGLFRSGFFTYFSNAQERIGFDSAREFAHLAYNFPIPIPPNIIHAVDRNAYLVEQWLSHPIERTFPIAIPAESQKKIQDWLPFPAIAIVPGSRWPSKCWPTHHFTALITGIIQCGIHVVLVGGKGDLPLAEKIIQQLQPNAFKNLVINLIGQTSLQELAGVLAQTKIVISNDSGPMHIAVAVGTPTIALFGPTSPEKTGPYGNLHRIIQSKPECWPCRKKECHFHPSCMEQIQPSQVLTCVKELLGIS